jgi:hypothetical protein
MMIIRPPQHGQECESGLSSWARSAGSSCGFGTASSVALERDPEKEPQRRDRLVEGRHTNAARRQMQLIATHVLERRRVG